MQQVDPQSALAYLRGLELGYAFRHTELTAARVAQERIIAAARQRFVAFSVSPAGQLVGCPPGGCARCPTLFRGQQHPHCQRNAVITSLRQQLDSEREAWYAERLNVGLAELHAIRLSSAANRELFAGNKDTLDALYLMPDAVAFLNMLGKHL